MYHDIYVLLSVTHLGPSFIINCTLPPSLPHSFSQDAFDKLTVDSANQQASAVAAAVTAADQKASFGDQMAKATLDASDQKAQFEGQMAKAQHDAAGQKATFATQMAKAKRDAGGMKARLVTFLFLTIGLFNSRLYFASPPFLRSHLTS